MSDLIKIQILNNGIETNVEVPNDIGLSLMELLKANDFEKIEGTCGGMALCASCHVKVRNATPNLPEQNDEEIAMLETLPLIFAESRLACQIKLNQHITNISIEIPN